MKSNILILFIAAISLNAASGQKVNIQMKGGFLDSKIDYSWKTPVKNESHSSAMRPTFALSVDGQLYKGLYLGAEIGTCSYLHWIDIFYTQPKDYFPPFTVTNSYLGRYKQEQVYFTINPQYRFGYDKFFVIGGGAGIYNNYVNTFSDGFASDRSSAPNWKPSDRKLDGEDYLQPNTAIGGFINAILNPKFDNIGLVVEMRYIFNNYYRNGQITQVKPDIRFNSWVLMGGLSFHF